MIGCRGFLMNKSELLELYNSDIDKLLKLGMKDGDTVIIGEIEFVYEE